MSIPKKYVASINVAQVATSGIVSLSELTGRFLLLGHYPRKKNTNHKVNTDNDSYMVIFWLCVCCDVQGSG